MSEYHEFFLRRSNMVVRLECLEISHPNFTQTYYRVRNAIAGVTVTLETGVSQFFAYYPMQISAKTVGDNLDVALEFQLGDLGEVLPLEFDAIAAAGGFGTKPTVKYREYRSDDLTAPMQGPLELEVQDFAFTWEGSMFTAKAPSLNVVKTGKTYDLDTFPMLRGFL